MCKYEKVIKPKHSFLSPAPFFFSIWILLPLDVWLLSLHRNVSLRHRFVPPSGLRLESVRGGKCVVSLDSSYVSFYVYMFWMLLRRRRQCCILSSNKSSDTMLEWKHMVVMSFQPWSKTLIWAWLTVMLQFCSKPAVQRSRMPFLGHRAFWVSASSEIGSFCRMCQKGSHP